MQQSHFFKTAWRMLLPLLVVLLVSPPLYAEVLFKLFLLAIDKTVLIPKSVMRYVSMLFIPYPLKV